MFEPHLLSHSLHFISISPAFFFALKNLPWGFLIPPICFRPPGSWDEFCYFIKISFFAYTVAPCYFVAEQAPEVV